MQEPPAGSGPGWYRSPDDPPNTHRYWDGEFWIGDAEPIPSADERRAAGIDAPIAGAGRRIGARLIDLAINVAVIILLTGVIDGDLDDATPSVLATLAALVFTAGYEIILTTLLGGTVGKLLLGLRVTEIDGTTPPSPLVATRRWGPNVLTLLPVLGQFIGLIILVLSLAWITSDPQRRSVFDRAGPTYVVRVN
jgi:uncharacterized RDD family membrane protein YckC